MSGNTTGPYVNTSGRVAYTVSGLQPSTEYLFRVTVHNGVSDQDVDSEEARSCDTLASTADIGRCNVVRLNAVLMMCEYHRSAIERQRILQDSHMAPATVGRR